MDKVKHGRSRKRPSRYRESKVSFQPKEPSNLRYELLQREEILFRFITWPKMESVTWPEDLAESLDLDDFITVDGEPGFDYDELLLFVSMNWAALRLTDEHLAPLAEELGRLRVILLRSRRGTDSPFGPTSGQLTDELIGEDDKTHIVCRNDVSDKIRIWMIDAGRSKKSRVARIEKCTASTRLPLPAVRKRCALLASKYVLIAPKRPRLE